LDCKLQAVAFLLARPLKLRGRKVPNDAP
jgi:hypothetical protein